MEINCGVEIEDLNNIVSIIKKNIHINEALLFGSRAKGNFRTGSDIYIALKGKNLSLETILNLQMELELLMLPYKFDLIIFDRIKEESLIEHINRCGILLFKNQNNTVS